MKVKLCRYILSGIAGTLWFLTAAAFPIAPFFPLTDNATWGYRINLGPADAVTRTVQPGTTTINSVPAKAIAYSSGVVEHYTNDPSDGIRLHRIFAPPQDFGPACGSLSKTDTLSLPFVHSPADVPSFPAATGTQSGIVNRVLAPGGPCPAPGTVFTYSGSSTVQDFEVVTVPLGSFQTVRIVSNLTITLDDLSLIVYTRSQTLWLASGIGVVKESRTETTEFTNLSQTLELTSTNVVRTAADPFTFNAVTGAAPGSTVSSNVVTVTGITGAANVTISGSMFRINGGSPVTSGSVANGQTLQVVVVAPASIATVVANLTVGGVTVPFSVSTGSIRSDFNGDGKSDILWRNATSGDNYLYPMSGLTVLGTQDYLRNVPTPWTIAGIGDFDGDGKVDIFWRNTVTGDTYVYLMNGTAVVGEGYGRNVPSDWAVAGIGDLNGDGRADIVWRNTSTGDNYVYFMNGLAIASEGYLPNVPSPWTIAAIGDHDGDGKADLFWRNTSSGDTYFFLMNGLTIANQGYGRNVPTDWAVMGAGDHDGDGKADLLWRNATTGDNYLFLLNGMSLAGEGYLRNVLAPWTIVGTGDYDGDGKADILWRNTSTGDDYLFLMNGLGVTSEGYLPSVPTNWAVVQ